MADGRVLQGGWRTRLVDAIISVSGMQAGTEGLSKRRRSSSCSQVSPHGLLPAFAQRALRPANSAPHLLLKFQVRMKFTSYFQARCSSNISAIPVYLVAELRSVSPTRLGPCWSFIHSSSKGLLTCRCCTRLGAPGGESLSPRSPESPTSHPPLHLDATLSRAARPPAFIILFTKRQNRTKRAFCRAWR